LKRRSREPELYRGKIAGPVLTTLSVYQIRRMGAMMRTALGPLVIGLRLLR